MKISTELTERKNSHGQRHVIPFAALLSINFLPRQSRLFPFIHKLFDLCFLESCNFSHIFGTKSKIPKKKKISSGFRNFLEMTGKRGEGSYLNFLRQVINLTLGLLE